MITKAAQLRALMVAEDWRGALKLAATFGRLGRHTAAIQRGWEAYARPEFYRQLGRDIDAMKADGRAALCERYR